MALLDYSSIGDSALVEIVGAAQEIWPIAAGLVGVFAGLGIINYLLVPPDVHTGREEQYNVPDDGYHDRHGGEAADYVDDFEGTESGVINGDWREAISRRSAHIDDDPDFDFSEDGDSLVDAVDEYRDEGDSVN